MTKGEYIDKLKLGPCEVTFTKVNGESRVMVCTLDEGVVPQYEKKTDRTKASNDDVVSVCHCHGKRLIPTPANKPLKSETLSNHGFS